MTLKDDQDAWLSRVLGVGESLMPWDEQVGEPAHQDGPLVAYRKALLGFRAARSDVQLQLQNLSARLVEQLPQEAELARKVADDVERICGTLSDGIDDGLNAIGEGRPAQLAKVRDDVVALMAAVGANRLIAHVDRNPVAPTSVAATLITALSRVAATVN